MVSYQFMQRIRRQRGALKKVRHTQGGGGLASSRGAAVLFTVGICLVGELLSYWLTGPLVGLPRTR